MKCPHCETHIDEHEANRCLDAWVAEKVMKLLSVGKRNTGHGYVTHLAYYIPQLKEYRRVPDYSTRIADGWQVVERMMGDGYCVDIRHDLCAWSVLFTHADNMGLSFGADWKQSLEAQICEAALKAVGHA